MFILKGFLIKKEGVEKLYLALYRKYRPRTFDDVISQEHITTTLRNQLKNGQTSHAYLFTGSRGTGKTTCAKILAKAINCIDKKDGNPCLECDICRAVADEAPDIVEIDAASNTGVENIRALKEEAVYTPIVCKYKVYIIDEVHMLSTAAFNALLKLIEEPPAHVVFIFATTELHKIPATILSRCQRFDFRRIDINDSKKRLLEIAGKEGMELDEEAAFLISRISDGGMRDALSLLDQCFAVSNHVTEAVVRSCAGISGTEHLFKIADAVIEENCAAAVSVLDGLVQQSKNPVRLMEELVAHYRILMLLQAGASDSVLRISADEKQKYQEQNRKYSMETILRAISILNESLSGKNRSKNEQLTCEMCFIRMCTPSLDVDEQAFSGRIDKLERIVKNLVENGVKTVEVNAEPIPAKEAATDISAPDPFAAEEAAPFEEEQAEAPAEETAPPPYEDDYIPPPWEENPPPPSDIMEIPLPFEAEQIIPVPQEEQKPADDLLPIEQLPEVKPEEKTEESGPVSLSEAVGLPPSRRTEEKPDKEPWKKDKPKDDYSEEGFEPFAQWNEVVNRIGFSAQMLLEGTSAQIKDTTLMVCGSELGKSNAVGEFRKDIQDKVFDVTGKRVFVTAQKKKDFFEQEENYVNDFLGYAESLGVEIKKL